jgi:hypothetical protein
MAATLIMGRRILARGVDDGEPSDFILCLVQNLKVAASTD